MTAISCCKLSREKPVHPPLAYAWLKNVSYNLHLSEEVLAELAGVLKRPTIRARYPELTDDIVEDFLKGLRSIAQITGEVPRRFSYPRDVDDEPYLNLAIEAEANYLVSRDKDLLDLMIGFNDECKEFRQRFRSLTVIEPIEFLKEVRRYLSEVERD